MKTFKPDPRVTPLGKPGKSLDGWSHALAGTAALLDRWVATADDDYDLPWQYNETAITGFVVSAIWGVDDDAMAIQDYRTRSRPSPEKRPTIRRPDIWAVVGGDSFRMEAKRSWVPAGKLGLAQRMEEVAGACRERAEEQLHDLDEPATWLGRLCYLVPYLSRKSTRSIDEVVQDLSKATLAPQEGWRGYRLDYYPPKLRHPGQEEDSYRHPGLTILAEFTKL